MLGGWHKREILPFWAGQVLVLHLLGRTIDDNVPQLYTTVVLAHYPLLTANIIVPTMMVTVFCIGVEIICYSVESLSPTRLLVSAVARSLGWAVYVGMCAAAAPAGYGSALDTLASLTLFGAGLGQVVIAGCHLYSTMRGKWKTKDSMAEEGTALSDLNGYTPVSTADTG